MGQSLAALVDELRKKRASAGLNSSERRMLDDLEQRKATADEVVSAIRSTPGIRRNLISSDYAEIRKAVR